MFSLAPNIGIFAPSPRSKQTCIWRLMSRFCPFYHRQGYLLLLTNFLFNLSPHRPDLLWSLTALAHFRSIFFFFFFFSYSESTIEQWSFWVFSTPFQSLFTLITSQWESCALYSFWAPNWCFSIFCTFTLLYTNITELNLSKLLPTGWLWRFHSNPIIFFLYFIFYNIYLFTDPGSLTASGPIGPILYECGAIVTTLSYYITSKNPCTHGESTYVTKWGVTLYKCDIKGVLNVQCLKLASM